MSRRSAFIGAALTLLAAVAGTIAIFHHQAARRNARYQLANDLTPRRRLSGRLIAPSPLITPLVPVNKISPINPMSLSVGWRPAPSWSSSVFPQKGDVKRARDGSLLYFNGREWTSVPTPLYMF